MIAPAARVLQPAHAQGPAQLLDPLWKPGRSSAKVFGRLCLARSGFHADAGDPLFSGCRCVGPRPARPAAAPAESIPMAVKEAPRLRGSNDEPAAESSARRRPRPAPYRSTGRACLPGTTTGGGVGGGIGGGIGLAACPCLRCAGGASANLQHATAGILGHGPAG